MSDAKLLAGVITQVESKLSINFKTLAAYVSSPSPEGTRLRWKRIRDNISSEKEPAPNDEKILRGVISQMEDGNGQTKKKGIIDFKELAEWVGSKSPEGTRLRWKRVRGKIAGEGNGDGVGKAVGEEKVSGVEKKKKRGRKDVVDDEGDAANSWDETEVAAKEGTTRKLPGRKAMKATRIEEQECEREDNDGLESEELQNEEVFVVTSDFEAENYEV